MEGVECDRGRAFCVPGGAEPDQLIVTLERGPPVGRGEAKPLRAAHHWRELVEHGGERPVRGHGHEHAVELVVRAECGFDVALLDRRAEPAVGLAQDSELCALPAVAGALVVAVAWELDAYEPIIGAVAAAAVFGIRGLALHHPLARTPRLEALSRPVHARTSALGPSSRWFATPAMARVISSSARSVRSMCRTPASPPSARPCTYGRPMRTASAPRASAR